MRQNECVTQKSSLTSTSSVFSLCQLLRAELVLIGGVRAWYGLEDGFLRGKVLLNIKQLHKTLVSLARKILS